MKEEIQGLIENIYRSISEFEQRTGIDVKEIKQEHYISGGVSVVTSRNIILDHKGNLR